MTDDVQTSRFRRTLTIGAVAVSAFALAACSSGGTDGGGDADAAPAEVSTLDVIAPADPGGGWDQTARAVSAALTGDELVGSAPVTNIGGAGGTVGLASLATESDFQTVMVTGSVMVGAVETNASENRIEDMTPIARLTQEPLVIVVPADSEFETVEDLVDAVVEDGPQVTVTGGSAGGIDHILAGQLLIEAGVDSADVPTTLNYIANSGGGEALTMLLGGTAMVGISGVGEFAESVESGDLRALAVSSAEQHRERAHELARAPRPRRHLRRRAAGARRPRDRDARRQRVDGCRRDERLDRRLPHRRRPPGLPRRGHHPHAGDAAHDRPHLVTVEAGAPEGAPASTRVLPRAHRIEAMVVVGVVIALAVATLVLTTQIREAGTATTLGARVIPYAVGGLLLVSGIGVLVGQLRGRFGDAEEGEDVDLDAGTSWITTGIVALAFLSLVVTIPHLGWPLAVTVLFAASAIALGARRWWVAVLVGLGLGIVSQLLFGTLLGLSLPATGTLTGWIPLG
jgi:putative tricarboxylic transport membrane protein